MPELPRGMVTFLFTDIEGSTALWERNRRALALRQSRDPARDATGSPAEVPPPRLPHEPRHRVAHHR
jgi:hypothetical protein